MELIDDLEKINLLDTQSYQKAINVISSEDSAEEWKFQLKEISKDDKEDSIYALIRFLNFLSENITEAGNCSDRIIEIEEFLAKLLKDHSSSMHGWERIKNSISDLEGFFLRKKEENIKNRFSRVTSFKVVTDIRPIFNMDKKSISKLTFPSILKIETSDEKEFICEFYEDTLDELMNELERVKEKLKLIKNDYGRK